MLKAAIVGCGKIADAHATILDLIEEGDLVAVCDRELLMAQQLQERFGVASAFDDLDLMLAQVKPDVVHITTPPQTHFPIAKQCLENGCHVYVEKPFTLYPDEAVELVALAEKLKLNLTAGHDAQFSPAAQLTRKHIKNGYIGPEVVHMEGYYGYELGSVYGNAMLDDKNHWVRRLPGKLLHNIISHGIARIAEHLKGDNPEVIARGFASPLLKSVGESELVDELRVTIVDDEKTTAYFTFSSQIRPSLHYFRAFGSENGVFMDEQQQCVLKLCGKRYTSYADKFIPSANFALQYIGNFFRNTKLFLKNNFHMETGKKTLISCFYKAIINEEAPPISPKEIVLTAKIMDAIFKQIYKQSEPQ